MLKTMLVDSATLYNFLGEDENGVAVYQRTYFSPCRVVLTTGTRLDKENDNISVYIFDAETAATDGTDAVTYCERSAFDELIDQSENWTLRDDGKDWIAKGIRSETAPPFDGTAYAIRTVKRYAIGSDAIHHWKVTGR